MAEARPEPCLFPLLRIPVLGFEYKCADSKDLRGPAKEVNLWTINSKELGGRYVPHACVGDLKVPTVKMRM